ncbi:MAG: rRNA pseudouridine synthase [Bdellovibrionales bacterium]|nr:rRNA pseudouridine synthase [Bdellovibrionales bacterium]
MADRLQKILSRSGLLSRRKAEEAITQGRVALNGVVVRQLGTTADPETDVITLDGRVVESGARARRTVALHKPKGVVTTRSDPEGRRTVIDLLPRDLRGLRPVGRLDLASEGLLLVSDDGDLMLRLTHPRYGVRKRYAIEVEGKPLAATVDRLLQGVTLDDGPGKFVRVDDAGAVASGGWRLEVEVEEGRNRFVRRMLEAVGHPVKRLIRLKHGPVELGALGVGAWRDLTPREINELKKLTLAADTPRETPDAPESIEE